MKEVKAYCVKCKEKRPLLEPKVLQLRLGRTAYKGRCSECSTGIFKIMPKKPRTFEEEMQLMIDEGYMASDLAPIRCIKCDEIDYKDVIVAKGESWIEEFKRVCSCGHVMGWWGYGNWML